MVGGTRIIAFQSGSNEPDGEEFLLQEEIVEPEAQAEDWPVEDEPARAQSRSWALPVLALTTIAGWTGFFLWARQGLLSATTSPVEWPGLISDWATPVLLVGVIWLVAMRNSRREAVRFGDTARILSDESARLEARLTTINRELSLAREFIASQARDLDALGRLAVDRISANSDRLQTLIHDNGARIDSIGSVSEAALDNMEKLRGQLPVIASSAKDVTNNIGNAGRTAHTQLAEMVSGFQKLNEFGQASERQVQSLRGQIDDALAEFSRQCEQLEGIASTRFASLAERGTEFRTQLDKHEVEALAAIRSRASALAEEVTQTRQQLDAQEEESLTSLRARLAALRDEGGALARSIRDGETRSLESWREAIARIDEDLRTAIAAMEGAESRAVENASARIQALIEEASRIEAEFTERGSTFAAELESRRTALEADQEAALARLAERLAALDGDITARRAGHERQSAALSEHNRNIAAELAAIEQQLSLVAARSADTEASFSANLNALMQHLESGRTAIAGTDRDIAMLTDASVRLLEILQASKLETRDELQGALAASEERLSAFEGRIAALLGAVTEAGQRGESLSVLIQNSEAELRASFDEIEERQATFGRNNAAQGETLVDLRNAIAEIETRSALLSEKAQGELSEAIDRLLASANEAVLTINETGSRTISALAGQLGEESASAIDKAMRASAAEAAGQLEMAASHAAGVGREAAIQLRDQLAKVNELVGNLERRVTQARQRAEEQVDNDFARRAALITESLNSNAIDIAKVLSTDVSDTAWSSYLRGDRGIFTRRAVSLIEAGEAKAITQVFERDQDFREHVSRYIHDFEAILRQVLSTRDGHALGITLLSSDMGKLYVALAQAIERLRR